MNTDRLHRRLLAAGILAVGAAFIPLTVGCDEGPAEDAGEAIDEAANDAGRAVDDVID